MRFRTPAAEAAPLAAAAGREPGTGQCAAATAPGSNAGWRAVADLLAEQLRKSGISCGIHRPGSPLDSCPHCGDERAMRIYRAAVAMADRSEP